MCGRYALAVDAAFLATEFEVALREPLVPRYNVSPSQPALVIREQAGEREATILSWGLLPAWSKTAAASGRLINARAETVASKPSFRSAYKRRRCLVPASGYYEWRALADGKQPYYIHPVASEVFASDVFALGGLWERWERDGTAIETFALLTCAANERLLAVHDRMPVIIARGAYGAWLDPGSSSRVLEALLVPAPPAVVSLHPVSRLVNSPRNDTRECIVATTVDDA